MEIPSNFFGRQYLHLIEKCRQDGSKYTYLENHHIYPVAIYGQNETTVAVSWKHHVILHYLLFRCFAVASNSAQGKAFFAVKRMLGNGENAHNGRLATADDLRLAYKALQTIKWPEEARQQISNTMSKKWQDPEYRKKMSDAHKGAIQSPETIAKRKATIAGWSAERRELEKLKVRKAIEASGNKPGTHVRSGTPEAKAAFEKKAETLRRKGWTQEAASQKLRDAWADPMRREELMSRETPEVREKKKASSLSRWQKMTPEERAEHGKKVSEGKRRQKVDRG